MTTTYKIGEAAALLNLKTYVLRFWETEFPDIVPLRTEKGQRLYTPEHLALLERIRFLLHERGLTIGGARKALAEEKAKGVTYVFGSAPEKDFPDPVEEPLEDDPPQEEPEEDERTDPGSSSAAPDQFSLMPGEEEPSAPCEPDDAVRAGQPKAAECVPRIVATRTVAVRPVILGATVASASSTRNTADRPDDAPAVAGADHGGFVPDNAPHSYRTWLASIAAELEAVADLLRGRPVRPS